MKKGQTHKIEVHAHANDEHVHWHTHTHTHIWFEGRKRNTHTLHTHSHFRWKLGWMSWIPICLVVTTKGWSPGTTALKYLLSSRWLGAKFGGPVYYGSVVLPFLQSSIYTDGTRDNTINISRWNFDTFSLSAYNNSDRTIPLLGQRSSVGVGKCKHWATVLSF